MDNHQVASIDLEYHNNYCIDYFSLLPIKIESNRSFVITPNARENNNHIL